MRVSFLYLQAVGESSSEHGVCLIQCIPWIWDTWIIQLCWIPLGTVHLKLFMGFDSLRRKEHMSMHIKMELGKTVPLFAYWNKEEIGRVWHSLIVGLDPTESLYLLLLLYVILHHYELCKSSKTFYLVEASLYPFLGQQKSSKKEDSELHIPHSKTRRWKQNPTSIMCSIAFTST